MVGWGLRVKSFSLHACPLSYHPPFPHYHSAAVDDYVAYLNSEFGIAGAIAAERTRAGGPCVVLTHPSGATATLDLHGAVVTSWTRPGGDELMARGAGGAGARPAFPLVGRADGVASLAGAPPPAVPADGVLGDIHWSVAGTGVAPPDAIDPAPSVCVVCGDTAATRSAWPHPFAAALTVSLMHTDDATVDDFDAAYEAAATKSAADEEAAAKAAADAADGDETTAAAAPTHSPPPPPPPLQLRFVLQIRNTGAAAMTFTAGMVAAFALRCPPLAGISGTAGRIRFDVATPGAPPTVGVDESVEDTPLDGVRHVDRLYVGTGRPATAPPPPERPPPNAWMTAGETPPAEFTPTRDPWARSDAGVTLRTGDLRHELEAIPRRGFRDVGVRAPAPPLGVATRRSAAAVIGEVARAVRLPPGAVFTGEAVVRLHDTTGRAPVESALRDAFFRANLAPRAEARARAAAAKEAAGEPTGILTADPGAAVEELDTMLSGRSPPVPRDIDEEEVGQ